MSAEVTERPVDAETDEAPPQTGHRGGGDVAVSVVSHGVLILWSLLVVVPLLWTVMSSLKTTREILTSPFSLPASPQFINYKDAWQTAGIGPAFVHSLLVVGSALVLTMALGSMSAYVLARFAFPGRALVRTLIIGGLTFPIFLAVVPLFFILRQVHLLQTGPGLVAAYTAYAYPFTVFFLISFFAELPGEIAEAAAMDGANEWRIFFSVMLPMARPGLASVAILNFVGLWNQFLLPVVLNSQPGKPVLTQAMASFAAQTDYHIDYGGLFAASVLTVVPVLLVYLVFQRLLLRTVAQGGLKG